MLIKDLKRQIQYADDDLEVMVSDDKLIATPSKVLSANVQLLFQAPVETEPNKFRMELRDPLEPAFIITTKRESNQ